MKRLLGDFLVGTTAILAGLLMLSLPSGAQTRTPAPAADSAKKGAASVAEPPIPRMPGGHPDLSGVYFPGPQDPENYKLGAEINGANRKFPREFEKPSFQPWVLEKAKLMGNLEQADPEIGCAPPGGPGFFYKGNYAIKMIQNPKELVILSEIFTTYRIIYTDGRQHPKPEDLYPQFMGDAIGHWEGDTLVVDTIGVDTHTWVAGLLSRPFFASDIAHYRETFRRPNFNHFLYQFTLDDPKVLTKPFTSPVATYSWSSHKPITEYYCTNNLDEESLYPKIPRTANGADERYFDEQEYGEMIKKYNQK